MSLKSKLKIESLGALLFSMFYAVTGIIYLLTIIIYDLGFVHCGILGILSLITALGMFKMKKWSVWLVAILFISGNTFALTILLSPMSSSVGILFQLALTLYLLATWIVSLYVLAKRGDFQ